MSPSARVIVVRAFAATGLLIALSCCTRRIERLDEAVIVDSPALKLKVVRYYESMPWHYIGEIYTVQCATPQTRSMRPRTKTDEAGWAEVERGGAIGSKSAAEIEARIRDNYRIIDGYAIVMVENGFRASLNGCQTFIYWNGWDLPEHLVHQAPKPAHCKDARRACPWENFRGDRSLRFSEVKVDPRSEQISMLVDSTAFKNNKRMAVSSVDGGKTWTIVPVDRGAAEQSVQPDRRENAAPG